MKQYNPHELEPRWQKVWEETGQNKVETDGSKPKKLHIQVDSSDGDVVNIYVPLGMASAVLGASSKLPGVVNLNLNDADVDMTLVAEAIKHGEKGTLIEVDGGDGDHVVISLE